ncbi:MAG: pilus assembly protein PilX [Proteobacteria bacterium]|nr:pilus assembly protein PilX [Pseudomonadota bacterium]
MNRPTRRPIERPARGVVLITTAVLLVVLMILALAGVSMISTQTRVATNSADVQVAYQAAEGALATAQNQLIAGTIPATDFVANAHGYYRFDTSGVQPPVWSDASIWSDAGKVVQGTLGNAAGALGYAYVIEQLPPVIRPGQAMNRPTQVYRITARATGRSGNAPVVLQSTVQLQ